MKYSIHSGGPGSTGILKTAVRRFCAVCGVVLLCTWFLAEAARAQVAIVMSKETAMYRETAGALASSLSSHKASVHVFATQDQKGVDELVEAVNREKPKVVVALGSKAAIEAAKAFPRTSLVYALVIYPDRLGITKRERVYGISWLPSSGLLARTFKTILPDAKRVGMLSSLPASAWSVQSADLKKLEMELVVASVKDSSDIPQALRSLYRKVDVLWMGVDPVLGTSPPTR